jgi:multicomponent K+:H+ antiporter subunit E
MIRKLLPHPLLTLLVTLVWLLLVNSYSINSLTFGLFLGVVVPLMTAAYWPDRPHLSKPWVLLQFLLIVLYDIVVANIAVAAIVVFKRNADLKTAWIDVPLDLRTPEAITILAGTITMTPGTVSCELSADGRNILVHCLHAPDPAAVRDEIKSRYEARIKEIFE